MNKKMKQLFAQNQALLEEAKLYVGNHEVMMYLVAKANTVWEEYLQEQMRYSALPIWKQILTSGR